VPLIARVLVTKEENRAVDETKESTLEEISELVRVITAQLKERKTILAPQIKTLREVRKVYQEVETEYNRKKQTYDKVSEQHQERTRPQQ
jgi:archaellum component FlaC